MKFVKVICLVSLFCLSNAFFQKLEPVELFDVSAFVEKFKRLPDEEKLAFAVWLKEMSDFKKDSIEEFAKKRFNSHEKSIKENQQLYDDFKRKSSNSPDFSTVNNTLRKSIEDADKREKEAQYLKALIDEIKGFDLLGKDQRSKVSTFKAKLAGKVLTEISKDKFLNKLTDKGIFNFQQAMHLAINKGDKELFEYLVQKHVLIEPSDENYYDKFIQMKNHKPAAATGAK